MAAPESKDEVNTAHYEVPASAAVAELKCVEAFEALTADEKAYAYYISQASWEGAKVTLLQTSPESPAMFALFQLLFSAGSPNIVVENAIKAGVDKDAAAAFLSFVASFYGNMGNYKSFGDTKLIPACSKEDFAKVVAASPAYEEHKDQLDALLGEVLDRVYDLSPRFRQLGLGKEKGISTYYSSNFEQEDAALLQEWLESKKIQPFNTRAFKTVEGEGDAAKTAYTILQAAAVKKRLMEEEFKGVTVILETGDYAAIMARIVANLKEAAKYAANDTQKKMLELYAKSFEFGDVEDHVEGSRFWIKDKGPVVENYIGFIESYRDPYGVRGEWEGFAAVVNKEQSAKFQVLVDCAEELLKKLPWDSEWEKDTFLRPDFTSLDILAFSGSGVPAGINIPNYDSVRQDEGFKNVSLGNVLSARDQKTRVTFIHGDQQDEFRALLGVSFEVQVGLHELLGHGSGKLFKEEEDGSKNWGEGVKNPLTGGAIESWYKASDSYDSVFKTIGSSLEECRAECVGIFLCVIPEILEVFGHKGPEAMRVRYINWLNMVRAGVMALMFYHPKTSEWGQAHMQARYAILRVLLEAGEGLCEITQLADLLAGKDVTEGDDGVHVRLDESKIESVGVPAIGKFLQKIQVYKATADYDAAKAMYDHYTGVSDDWLKLRDLVVAVRKPRPVFVQPVLSRSEVGDVTIISYDASHAGMTASFMSRFPPTDDALEALWKEEAKFHAYA